MKILMCCHLPLDAKFGGAKVYIETANAYRELGHDVDLFGYEEIAGIKHTLSEGEKLVSYPPLLKDFIKKRESNYDVIEYEYKFLPFKRSEFALTVKMVARSTLLIHHFSNIEIPYFKTLRGVASKLLKGPSHRKKILKEIDDATFCLQQADFINVPNFSDRDLLLSYGLLKDKMIISPYGLSEKRVLELRGEEDKYKNFKVAFVGTFDKRKGCVEFPQIIASVVKALPHIKFKLIGTKGMFSDEQSVLAHFPSHLKNNIEVIPSFDPAVLGELLSDCKLGVFPSHLESFGFGLLELYTAGIPCVSYKVPGPDMLSPSALLVERGDASSLANTLIELDKDKDFYQESLKSIEKVVREFCWLEQSKKAVVIYSK